MAIQTVNGGVVIPIPHAGGTFGPLSYSSMLLDAADEKAAFVVQAPKTGTISKVGFRTGTVTTGATVDVRLETVSTTSGDPTGTLWGTNTNGSQIIADTDDNVWFTTPLTNGASVSKGDLLAIVIVNPSGSPGNLNVSIVTWSGQRLMASNIAYADHYTTAWAKVSNQSPCCALEYSDGSYAFMPGVYPHKTQTALNFNSSGNPDEIALKFRLPFACRINGAYVAVFPSADYDVVLYDSDGSTILTSKSFDGDIDPGQTLTPTHFNSTVNLSANTYYRLALKPTTTTNISGYYFDVNSAAILDSLEGGQDFHYSQRVDAGAWTDTTTRRPLMGLFIDGIDTGGGLLVHPGMQGGIRG